MKRSLRYFPRVPHAEHCIDFSVSLLHSANGYLHALEPCSEMKFYTSFPAVFSLPSSRSLLLSPCPAPGPRRKSTVKADVSLLTVPLCLSLPPRTLHLPSPSSSSSFSSLPPPCVPPPTSPLVQRSSRQCLPAHAM